jgi:dihydrofolate synthase/folylpolyglutamate synthase
VGATADPILERLKDLHPKAIDLSLDRVLRLMADLGHPEARLPPAIHVAGTNGKGSTIATLRAILEAAGYRVHVYTSPHLVRFNERIRLAGELIDERQLAELLEEIERINAGKPITFFEVTTAAAFLAFARAQADIVLLETGMGGRLDATNIVERPLASVLTPISMDHMQFLGDTLPLIAAEKAGILKHAVPAVIGAQPDDVMAVLAAHAARVGAPRWQRSSEWKVVPRGDGFVYRGRRTIDLPLPSLPGAHQIDNAALAVATLDQLTGFKIADAHLRQGLGQIEWPGRLQRLTRGSLVALLPPGVELYLDGGHNEAAAEILADWAKDQRDQKLDLVFGMLSTKPPEKFLGHLAPHIRRLQAITIPNEHLALPAETIAEAGRQAGIREVAVAADVDAAIRALATDARRILICGSLYLAGKVLAENG